MSDVADYMRAAASAAQAVVSAIDRRPLESARHAVDAALALLSREEVAQLLTQQAIVRQNAIADQLEREKFGTANPDEPEEP